MKSHIDGGVSEGSRHGDAGRFAKGAELPLTAFELPTWLVELAVRSCRLFNTALDFIFYDVPTLLRSARSMPGVIGPIIGR
jgi:hypothetical protein